MAIAAADIHTRMATTAGAAGNSTAPGAAGTSLGKYITNADIVDNTVDNLFPDVTGLENQNLQADYQCVFVYNAHATLTWQGVVVWISSEVAGGDNTAIGVDTTAASAVGSAGAQALQVTDKNTAPAGVAFSSPSTQATGLVLGDIPPGQVKAFWIRRTATNSSAINNDGITWGLAGDTAA